MADLRQTIDRIRNGVKNCKPDGHGGFTCSCPDHEDKHPSMHFARKGDRVVLHCFSCHSTERILDRLGLDWPDLFDDHASGSFAKKARPERPLPGPIIRPKRPDRPEIDWQGLHAHLLTFASRPDRLIELAGILGVTVESLEAAGCVWAPKFEDMDDWLKGDASRSWVDCWAWPDLDGKGKVIGMSRRFIDSSKKSMSGGRRGLFYDVSLAGHPDGFAGHCLLVEGPTDVCAGMSIGLNTIGRPSNTGGAQHAATLLALLPADVPIIVLGENDQKENGRWPGKEGAEKVAQELADAMPTRLIYVAYPPDGAKDLRAWQAGRCDPALGEQFLAALQRQRVFPCPRRSKEVIEEKTCADIVAVPAVAESEIAAMLPGLLASPPPWMCRRGGSSLFLDGENSRHYCAKRHACDCWHCSVCRTRLAVKWVEHAATCTVLATRNEGSPRTLVVREVPGSGKEWDALRQYLLRADIPYIAFEITRDRFFLVAAPRSDEEVSAAQPISLEDLGRRLVEWARTVRTGPRPFSALQTRPVRTSKHWRLPEQDFGGRWKYVAPLAALRLDTLLEALAECGIKPTRVEDAIFAACNPLLGKSCCWCVEWITSPEPECIGAMLRTVTEAVDPLPLGGRRETEPIPW